MIELLSGEMTYVFEALGEIDQDEGRGGIRSLGYFHSQEDATAAAKGEGIMGSPGKTRYVQVLKQNLDNGKFQYWQLHPIEVDDQETIRQRALGKLTLAEKKALGIK